MLDYKQGSSARVPVALVSTGTGLPSAGVLAAAVTCWVVLADGSATSVTVTGGGTWTELTAGNTLNSGEYLLLLPSSVITQPGLLMYFISTSGSDTYKGIIKVTANETVDVFNRLGAPVGASISADIAQVEGHAAASDSTGTAINTKLGTPAGASVSADIAAIQASAATAAEITAAVTSIKGSGSIDNTQLAGASFDTTQHSLAVLGGQVLPRMLGMLHENSVLDQTSFDGNNNLTNGRLRLYNSKTNADAATAASPGPYSTGLIAQYAIIATYTGTNLQTYEVARVA